MRGPGCRVAQLPAGQLLPGTAKHVETCLSCQADAARARRLRRDLRRLGQQLDAAPPGLAAKVAYVIEVEETAEADLTSAHRGVVRQVAAAGAVAATAAGAVAVVLWRRMHSAA